MHLSSKHYITTFIRAESEHRQILSELVSNLCRTPDVAWNQPDGLQRLHTCIEKIFVNGLRPHKPDNSPDCWRFIEGLNWLNPQMTASIANHFGRQSATVHIPFTRIRNDKALKWIYESLETKTLSKKLTYLLSDSEHLTNCYEITAYLHSKRYVNALFICLNALETEQASLLSQIDQNLYETTGGERGKSHKRSTSHPNFSYGSTRSTSSVVKQQPTVAIMGNSHSLSVNYDDTPDSSRRSSFGQPTTLVNLCNNEEPMAEMPMSKVTPAKKQRKHSNRIRFKSKHVISQKFRPWTSLPDIRQDASTKSKRLTRSKSQTIRPERIRLTAETLAINDRREASLKLFGDRSLSICGLAQSTPASKKCSRHQQFASDNLDLTPINLVKCDDIKIHLDRKHVQSSRGEASIAPLGVSSLGTTPGTSPAVSKSGQLTDFLRSIPGKRNFL